MNTNERNELSTSGGTKSKGGGDVRNHSIHDKYSDLATKCVPLYSFFMPEFNFACLNALPLSCWERKVSAIV